MQDIITKKRELRALREEEFDIKFRKLSTGENMVLMCMFSGLLLLGLFS